MQQLLSVSLSDYSSFGTGGNAEKLVLLENAIEARNLDFASLARPLWLFGYGTDSLISDDGLPGTVIVLRGGKIEDSGNKIIVDSGVSWDDFVIHAIRLGLWGVELMSGIPGGIGAAIYGNIAAYGQAVSDTLTWVEVIDLNSHEITTINKDELGLKYRYSDFQTERLKDKLILRAEFELAGSKTKELEYASAVSVAEELGLDVNNLADRQKIIMEARKCAGSLLDKNEHKNAGSFFKNPNVRIEQLDDIIKFDESGKAKEQILKQQQIHGGETTRVSAALVMLAAGYQRGQTWGPVRLHPQHVLKIENTGDASSQQIYDVAQEIIRTVKDKLDITLEPEVRFAGKFN